MVRKWIEGASVLVAVLLAGCGNETDPSTDAAQPSPLRVGMELAYPPFEMRGPDNEPDGISVRMAEDLGEFLGRPVEIYDIPFDGIIAALRSGKIDVTISSMTRTEERARAIAFSDHYVTNGLCMLVAKDSAIESADDLKEDGVRVAVKIGTTGQQWADRNLPEADKVVLDSAATCVLEVVQGKADAFIYDQISIYRHWKSHSDVTRPILEPIRQESWAIGLRQEDAKLLENVNRFLADYRAAGRFDELAERYMAEEKAAFEERGVPFIFH